MILSYPDRVFNLWEYIATNDFLVLKSWRDGEGTIHLIFAVVGFLAIPDVFRGLRVEQGSDADIDSVRPWCVPDREQQVFVLITEGKRYPIVAAHCFVEESDRDYMESPFVHQPGSRPYRLQGSAIRSGDDSSTSISYGGKNCAYPDRTFQFWEYSVSFARLLVRSPKVGTNGSNVELRFRGVSLIVIPRTLEGVVIEKGTDDDIATASHLSARELREEENVFALVSRGVRYLVVACGLISEENDAERYVSPFRDLKW